MIPNGSVNIGTAAFVDFGDSVAVTTTVYVSPGHYTAYYDFFRRQERLRNSLRELRNSMARVMSNVIATPALHYTRRVKNRPWYSVFATPQPILVRASAQDKVQPPEYRRGKSAPLDRVRRKRRRFLQKLRAA